MQYTTGRDARRFAEHRHSTGAWNTRVLRASSPLIRRLSSYISFKRKEASVLAARTSPGTLTLDLGAGAGAYSKWFLDIRHTKVVACDWSFQALCAARSLDERILPVCADARFLPFSNRCFGAALTIDMLGHIPETESVIAELRRVARGGARIFLHSECADYRNRWPDRMLIDACGEDAPAAIDGHTNLKTSGELIEMTARQFIVEHSYSPAGRLGWLLGYPEKYRLAFRRAGKLGWYALTSLLAACKGAPGAGLMLRIINSMTNYAELAWNHQGGGSVFIRARTPADTANPCQPLHSKRTRSR